MQYRTRSLQTLIRFSHYNLRAPRPLLEELRDFYVSIVGLREGPRPPFQVFGYWLYAGDKAVLHLAECRAEDVAADPARTSFSHVAFDCEGLEQARQRLTRRSIPFRGTRVPLSGEPQLFFKDPAGNGVELIFESRADDAGGRAPKLRRSGW